MMPKYIKIKSATGKGEMVVKRSLIERVEDRDDGGATIHCSDCVYQTASTAAEVLEAMEGKQEVRGITKDSFSTAYMTSHDGKRYGLRFHENGAIAFCEPEPERTFPGLDHLVNNSASEPPVGAVKYTVCTCDGFAGEKDDCPTHGIGTAWRDLHGE